MRKDRGLVKAEHEEKGLHPKSWLWVTEIKTTGWEVKQVGWK